MSKKTTFSGIVALLLLAVKIVNALVNGGPIDIGVEEVATGATAVGLIFAKDRNVTGGNVDNGLVPPTGR